jgi:hypothetical protein
MRILIYWDVMSCRRWKLVDVSEKNISPPSSVFKSKSINRSVLSRQVVDLLILASSLAYTSTLKTETALRNIDVFPKEYTADTREVTRC